MTTTVHADSTDVWARAITDNFISLSVTPTDTGFHGTLDAATLGEGVTVTRVENTAAVVSRTTKGVAADSCDDVLVLTPLRGSLIVTQNGSRRRLHPGMVSVHVAEQPYDLDFPQSGGVLVLQAPRRFAPAPLLSPHVRSAAGTRSRPLVSVFRSFLEEALVVSDRLTRIETDAVRQTATSLALTVLTDAATEPGAPDSTATALRAQAYIRAHLGDSDLSPTRVAAHFHVSLRYLQLAFGALGTTPASYIREARLEHARHMLRDPATRRMSVSWIAATVGLEEGTFRRAYKIRYGRTPGDDRP